jgi:hypothetical protein
LDPSISGLILLLLEIVRVFEMKTLTFGVATLPPEYVRIEFRK